MITLLVVRSDNFLLTLDSLNSFYSSFSPASIISFVGLDGCGKLFPITDFFPSLLDYIPLFILTPNVLLLISFTVPYFLVLFSFKAFIFF